MLHLHAPASKRIYQQEEVKLMQKRGISPLVATLLLVAFALVIGAITMTWGKSYVEKAQEQPKKDVLDVFKGAIIIGIEQLDDPLKSIQLQYITGKISREQYLQQEQDLLDVEKSTGPSYCSSDADCVKGFTCWYKIPSGSFSGIKGTQGNPGKCYSDATISKIV